MLLVLSLVYLFHGIQTQAAPLTNIFSDTSAASSSSGCVCPADQRSIWDILWSSLAIIFACSWVSVHPNIPAPDEAGWRILLRRLELMFWTVFGPELVIVWAFRQWLGARYLENFYKDRGWTKTHGYFVQMGGFMLYEGDVAKGVLDPGQFHKLVQAEKIRFPTITREEIEDRSKADAFSKTIAVGQTLWFIVQCLARRAEHLDITLIELLTLSLAVLNGVMYFLWWHKPLDARCPVRVELLGELDEPSAEAVNPKTVNMDRIAYSTWKSVLTQMSLWISEILRRREGITIVWQSSVSILRKGLKIVGQTIMIVASLVSFSSVLLLLVLILGSLFPFCRWISIAITEDFTTGDMKVPTFYASRFNEGKPWMYIFLMSVAGVVFGGIHCAGWFFIFPSSGEAILWRVSSVVLTSLSLLVPLLFLIVRKSELKLLNSLLPAVFVIAVIVYVLSRLFLLVEAFISLRHLTPGLLALVKWTSFIPHI